MPRRSNTFAPDRRLRRREDWGWNNECSRLGRHRSRGFAQPMPRLGDGGYPTTQTRQLMAIEHYSLCESFLSASNVFSVLFHVEFVIAKLYGADVQGHSAYCDGPTPGLDYMPNGRELLVLSLR
jgi:hypothetical protein